MNVQLMSTSREWSIPPPHLQRSQQLCHGEICLALRLQVGFAGAKDFECFCSFGKHPQRDLTVEKLLANDNTIIISYIRISIHKYLFVQYTYTYFIRTSGLDRFCQISLLESHLPLVYCVDWLNNSHKRLSPTLHSDEGFWVFCPQPHT